MDLNDTPELAEYRTQVRAWLDEHKAEAPTLRAEDSGLDEHAHVAARREWQRKLAEGGLAAVVWPADYGGQGLGPLHQVVVNQEIGRAGVPGIFDVIGVGMLGPTLIAHGDEEQKQRHLGAMLNADEVWCQLFSEPAAGSDLAAIQTRAKQADDGTWRLTGQKVWTTNAQHAAYGLLLARTDADVPKHKGLTMFIVPMDAPGVTIRPLRQISGEAHFNEVFFDDVALDAGSEVGPVNGGWGVGMTTLMFERVAIGLGGEGFGWRADRFAEALLADEAATRDPEVRHRYGEIAADFLALRFTGYRMLTTLQRGGIPGPEGALAKVTTIKAAIAAGELLVDVLGPEGLSDANWGELVSDLPGLKSAGGTEEILRNMVGERVLGLPPEPRLDKGVPFSELRAKEREAAGLMNFALTDEQEFLKEAARGALSRFKTVEAAREALDGGELPDLWPTAQEAGWAGLLISEEHGGAGLYVMEGMLVFAELGRVLAGVGLLGHLPATFLLERGGAADVLEGLASGEQRAAYLPARPPSDIEDRWTVDPRLGSQRAPAPTVGEDGTVSGEVAWVPDAPGADLFVVVGAGGRAALVKAADATRRGRRELRPDPLGRPRRLRRRARHAARPRRRRCGGGLVRRPGAPGGGVARRGRGRARGLGPVRQGALHLRARDRLLPGGQARPRGDPAAQRELALAHVLHRLGGPGQAGGVPGRGVGLPARRGPRARPRRARPDLRPRRHRRDVGARRAAVLPARPALPAAAGRHGGRRRPRGRRAARAARARAQR